MSTRSRRKQGDRVNYAEVDSDSDASSDREVKVKVIRNKGKGKAKAAQDRDFSSASHETNPAKTSRLGSWTPPDPDPQPEPLTYNSKLLLDLPFELFAEVCSHLPEKSMIDLAKVNKAFRKILVSRNATSIWSSRRRRLGYDLPQGMSELAFALWMYGQRCQVCGSDSFVFSDDLAVCLRIRMCYTCEPDHTMSAKEAKKTWPNLHPQALTCVRCGTSRHSGKKHRQYLIFDVVKADVELADLEEEDEITVSEIQAIRSKSSSTRSRGRQAVQTELKADAVQRYLQEKAEWVAREQGGSPAPTHLFFGHELDPEKARKAAIAAREAAAAAFLVSLERDFAWTQQEIERHSQKKFFAPSGRIEDDPQAWETWHETIKAELKTEAERRATAEAIATRKSVISPYYESVSSRSGKKDDATIDDEIWKKARVKVEKELDAFEEKTRVEAIRQILAANQGLSSITSLSKDSADYPKSTYNKAFFTRATSLFVTKVSYHFDASPYPSTTHRGDFRGPASLKSRINARTVHVMRALCEAAGLDPEQTHFSDLEELEAGFVWQNNPSHTFRNSKRSWSSLIFDVVRYGPSIAKIVGGETIEIEYVASESKKRSKRIAAVSETDDDDDGDNDVDDGDVDRDNDDEDDEESICASRDEEEEEQDGEDDDVDKDSDKQTSSDNEGSDE
ncbi:hypothetical protein JCM3766R1_006865 [Sporobolomyces carnicolor]